jgi:hypothetical protein
MEPSNLVQARQGSTDTLGWQGRRDEKRRRRRRRRARARRRAGNGDGIGTQQDDLEADGAAAASNY